MLSYDRIFPLRFDLAFAFCSDAEVKGDKKIRIRFQSSHYFLLYRAWLCKPLTLVRASTLGSLPKQYRTKQKKGIKPFFCLAEGEGFEPPDPRGSSVFKFYPAFVACHLLLLFNNPNCRKISVLTALLSDNSGFLLCFGTVSRSLLLLISSAFLTAFCRDFVDVKGNIFAYIGKNIKNYIDTHLHFCR